MSDEADSKPLRRGWTTGACATAATKAAYRALLTGTFPDPVQVTLPQGQTPAFALACQTLGTDWAEAGVVKDAGDDPDVTHGALIKARVRFGAPGSGVVFRGGDGVGQITKPGLPLPPGEPAINPAPRAMMRQAVAEIAAAEGTAGDLEIEIVVPDGARLAPKTWNPRLGILGGISILGTTGIVVPYSCAAWIASIHRGIDVARAGGLTHLAGATGATSEAAVKAFHGLPEAALIDMGDFVGGMLKYIRHHPVPRVTVAGGFAKMTKLGQGLLDLHSKRGQVDRDWLAGRAAAAGAGEALIAAIREANSALHVLDLCWAEDLPIGSLVARAALATAQALVNPVETGVDVAVFDRQGKLVGHA
ncbi:MAG: cobalt-precorrin-5B (C(1))-methyltransferase [Rhodospirillales bacterium]|nr:cobalt-precorrin-5B (C(1))-methyltransferase [Rhodospirillales bacterium]